MSVSQALDVSTCCQAQDTKEICKIVELSNFLVVFLDRLWLYYILPSTMTKDRGKNRLYT